MFKLTFWLLAGLGVVFTLADDLPQPKRAAVFTASIPAKIAPSHTRIQPVAQAARTPLPAVTANVTPVSFGNDAPSSLLRVSRQDAPAGYRPTKPALSDTDAIVAASRVNLRDAPSTKGAVLTQLTQGTNVRVLSQTGGWVELEVAATGTTGFMSARFISPAS